MRLELVKVLINLMTSGYKPEHAIGQILLFLTACDWGRQVTSAKPERVSNKVAMQSAVYLDHTPVMELIILLSIGAFRRLLRLLMSQLTPRLS